MINSARIDFTVVEVAPRAVPLASQVVVVEVVRAIHVLPECAVGLLVKKKERFFVKKLTKLNTLLIMWI